MTALETIIIAIVEGLNLIKCVIGYVMVKQQRWVVNLVGSRK